MQETIAKSRPLVLCGGYRAATACGLAPSGILMSSSAGKAIEAAPMKALFVQIKCELAGAEVANALVDAEIASEVYSTAAGDSISW